MAVVGNECLTMYSEGTLCNFSARSVVKVNRSHRPIITVIFSQASVSHSVNRGMGCLADTPPADKPLPSACWDTPPLPIACWDTHTPAATATAGTHPTGMHSCFEIFWRKYQTVAKLSPQGRGIIRKNILKMLLTVSFADLLKIVHKMLSVPSLYVTRLHLHEYFFSFGGGTAISDKLTLTEE